MRQNMNFYFIALSSSFLVSSHSRHFVTWPKGLITSAHGIVVMDDVVFYFH